MRCTLTVTSVSVPASTATTAGDTFMVTARLPAPNDGGGDDAAVPQDLFGFDDNANASSPPPARIDSGRYVLSVGRPSMRSPLMYCSRWCPEAPGAVMRMTLSAGRAISMRSNSGVLMVRVDVPGTLGYRPIAAQTYHADIAPKSSLPGSPSGVGLNSVLRTRPTRACVFHGWPM